MAMDQLESGSGDTAVVTWFDRLLDLRLRGREHGSLGTVIILLRWFILAGAELNAELERRTHSQQFPADRPIRHRQTAAPSPLLQSHRFDGAPLIATAIGVGSFRGYRDERGPVYCPILPLSRPRPAQRYGSRLDGSNCAWPHRDQVTPGLLAL
jgi:hypothetical protein